MTLFHRLSTLITHPVKFAATLFLLTFTLHANAGVTMFLKIDGIDGESADSTHRNTIDVLAFSEGASSTQRNKRAGSIPNFENISVTKWLDVSSPTLRLRMAQGAVIPRATLTVRKTGEQPFVFYKVELRNLRITSVSTGGSGGEDRLTENLSFNFTEIRWTYTKQNSDGSAGEVVTEGWDIAANKKL